MSLLSWKLGAAVLLAAATSLAAQTPQPQQPASPDIPPPPTGQVLFQSHGTPPEPDADRKPMSSGNLAADDLHVTDHERAAVRITAYALDAHLKPATSAISVHARLTLRNDGAEPMARVPLQISSTLTWDSASLADRAGTHTLALAQHLLDTDADHTGKADEAVFTLPRPLVPGGSATLDLFYSGTLARNTTRLLRIGASEAQAAATDWDGITASGTALRGFGDILWYPVTTPPLFLGDGNRLFEAVAHARLAGQTTRVRLHLTVEYTGDPPTAAFFCTGRQPFTAAGDSSLATGGKGGGIATADFPETSAGFRTLSLFTTEQPEQPVGSVSAVEVATADSASIPRLTDAVDSLTPMFTEWLGPTPSATLNLLDHPGQPFADGTLLVGPVAQLASSSAAEGLARSLSHAWVETGQPWIDDGLAEFFALQWTEREHGRPAAITQLDDLLAPLPLGEPEIKPETDPAALPPGQPLVSASDEVFFRRKAAAVWSMLRDIVGDDNFRAALTTWREHLRPGDDPFRQTSTLQQALEDASGQNLTWFFDDWVLHDKGLPDLSIIDVTPRPLPMGAGHGSGWLVAVTVHNDGAVAVDVPVVIRSGTFSTTKRLHINAFANATERVLVEAEPTEVLVNDGVTPEARTPFHSRALTIHE
jgi:hypothetical protein